MSVLSNIFGNYADDLAKAASKAAANSSDDVARALAKSAGSTMDDAAKIASKTVLTPEQESFFKNSVIRDSSGKLVPVYHSTPSEFSVFDDSMIGKNTGYENTGFGHFVSTDRDFSKKFKDIKNKPAEFDKIFLGVAPVIGGGTVLSSLLGKQNERSQNA